MSGFDEDPRDEIDAEIAKQFLLKDDCITELQRENAELKRQLGTERTYSKGLERLLNDSRSAYERLVLRNRNDFK